MSDERNGNSQRSENGHSAVADPAPEEIRRRVDFDWGARPEPARAPVAFARIDALSAAARYPLLVLLPILILGAAGVVLAKRKTTTYTATSQILVSAPTSGTAGELPGVVQAELSLSSIYAREVSFDPVVMPLAKTLKLSPAYVASKLAATPEPSAPIIKVSATAPNPGQAIALANGAGTKLASFINSQSQGHGPVNTSFSSYTKASTTLEKARAHLTQVMHSHPGPGNSNNPAVIAAQARVQEDQLIVTALGNQYQNAYATGQNSPTLSMFQSATAASGNSTSNLETYVFGGVVAGLVIGIALATLAANRGVIRDARRPAIAA